MKQIIKKIKRDVFIILAFISFLMFFSLPSYAEKANVSGEEKILSRSTSHDFKTTLLRIKTQLVKKNFQVAHVQRCDGGLKKMGYEMDKYQVVFFGRIDEIREMTTKYTELTPFLPFKLLIYIEEDKTVMSIMNPEMLKPMVTDKLLVAKLEQWRREFIDILEKAGEVSL